MYKSSIERRFDIFVYNSKVMLRSRYNKIYSDEYLLNHGFDKEYTTSIFTRDLENQLDIAVEYSLESTYRYYDETKPPMLPELTRDSGISEKELFDIIINKLTWLPKCIYHRDRDIFEYRFWTYWCIQYFLQKIHTNFKYTSFNNSFLTLWSCNIS